MIEDCKYYFEIFGNKKKKKNVIHNRNYKITIKRKWQLTKKNITNFNFDAKLNLFYYNFEFGS